MSSRQVQRREAFLLAFAGITKDYSGEPRRARRTMARAIAKSWWKKRKDNPSGSH